jgi:hypothetical protein
MSHKKTEGHIGYFPTVKGQLALYSGELGKSQEIFRKISHELTLISAN